MRSMYFLSTSAATGPAFALVLCSIGPVPSAMVRALRCDAIGAKLAERAAAAMRIRSRAIHRL